MEIRYVELDPSGKPFHENCISWENGPTEATLWEELKASAALKGQTLKRIRGNCSLRLIEIESDGSGGIKARRDFPRALEGLTIDED